MRALHHRLALPITERAHGMSSREFSLVSCAARSYARVADRGVDGPWGAVNMVDESNLTQRWTRAVNERTARRETPTY